MLRTSPPPLDLLYISPEAVVNGKVLPALASLAASRPPHLALVAIDEAHCVSSWGHDFRTSYLKLGPALRAALPKSTPLMALTATATEAADEDLRVGPTSTSLTGARGPTHRSEIFHGVDCLPAQRITVPQAGVSRQRGDSSRACDLRSGHVVCGFPAKRFGLLVLHPEKPYG